MLSLKQEGSSPCASSNSLYVNTDLNNRLNEWKLEPTANQRNLRIVLRKIDENPMDKYQSNGMSSTGATDFTFSSPKLTLRRIDSQVPFMQRNFPVVYDSGEKDGSFRGFHACYSTSIINGSEMRQMVTSQNIISVNSTTVLKSELSARRRPRNVLKDVKNTSELSSSINRKKCLNIFHDSGQSNLEGQENIPVASNYDIKKLIFPQVSVRLTQLNESLFRRNLIEKYVETTSTHETEQDNIKSRFESLTLRGIKKEVEVNSSNMIVENYTKTMNKIELPEKMKYVRYSSPIPIQGPSKKVQRKRKRKPVGYNHRRKRGAKTHLSGNARSSFNSHLKTKDNESTKFYQPSTNRKDHCETVPSSEISQSTLSNQIEDTFNIVDTKFICKETALQFHSTSFESQENLDVDYRKESSTLKQTDVTLNISSSKTVRKNSTLLDEFMEFSYSSIEEKKSEIVSPKSFGKRKLGAEETSNTSKKRALCSSYNYNELRRSSDGENQCIVYMKRIKNTHQSTYSIDTKSSSSYLTRKVAKNKESVEFYRIPWKKVKGFEVIGKNSNESVVKADLYTIRPDIKEELAKSTYKLNCSDVIEGTPAKSYVKADCCDIKPQVKSNVEIKSESFATEIDNSLFSYSTRQKTARKNGSVEFYRIPWKQTKGFEVVTNKAVKSNQMEDTDLEPTFQGWLKQKKHATKDFSVVLTALNVQETEKSAAKKGILKRNEMLASSTPFSQSSRKKMMASNVSFIDVEEEKENEMSPVKSVIETHAICGIPSATPAIPSCSVLQSCLSDNVSSSASRSKRRMTRREARRKAESFNNTKIALEKKVNSSRNDSDSSSSKSSSVLKRSARLANKKVPYYSSSDEYEEPLVDKCMLSTPYVRLNKLNIADVTSYKITPLKEDRIPKKSKTADDYGIDDINTDDSTDDEDFPKKCIPQWAKDYQDQPRYQSYVNPDLIFDWIKPPTYRCSLRTVFFSLKSHTYM